MDARDSGWPVCRDLLADRQMQPHMQKRILSAALPSALSRERFIARFEPLHILGMLGDHGGDLRLEGLERHAVGEFSPRIQIHAPQLVAVLSGKYRHVRS